MNSTNPGVVLGFAIALTYAGGAEALSPVPPLPVEELTEFYEAMDGDNWHRNDGWLDPETSACDWYGITCRSNDPWGFLEIDRIELRSNNLSGDLAGTQILRVVNGTLDLSHNQIGGPLPNFFTDLPPAFGQQPPKRWILANNQLEGEVPESWTRLALGELDLSGNNLTGLPDAAFRALATDEALSVSLADNQFSGQLPEWLTDIEFTQLPALGSINLCWTELEFDDPELADWVLEHHVGGPDLEACMGRERAVIDAGVSGSWFHPERDGEGFSLMLLDSGAPLIYWFTHISEGRQMWLLDVGLRTDKTLFLPSLLRTRGRFGEGFGDQEKPIHRKGSLRLDQIATGPLHGEYKIGYSTTEIPQEEGPVMFLPNPVSMRHDLVQLTRLAGTTCDNQAPNQWISGAWYDPAADGEGFVVEVTPDGRGVVYWFTYQPDGEEQAWMMGVGEFDGTKLVVDDLFQPRDTADAMPFDAGGIEDFPWGTLTMEFHDDHSGHVSYSSNLEEYGSGNYSIQRLARPSLAECDD